MSSVVIPEQEDIAKVLTRVFEAYTESKCVIRPHFLLSGESGTGKSHLISMIAKKYNVEMLEINAASLTKEGVSGNSLSKAMSGLLTMKTSNGVVIFVDEFDKLFTNGASSGTHEALSGVQNEFLTMLEKDTASVFGDYGKYINVNVGKALFVFAGAFNGEDNLTHERLRELGLRTEFLGRVSLQFSTKRISLESLLELVEHNILLQEYMKVFKSSNKKKVINDIKSQITEEYRKNEIGVRVVNQLVHQYFLQSK